MEKLRGGSTFLISLISLMLLAITLAPALSFAQTTPSFLTNYQLYDRGEDVLLLQQLLNAQGFVVAQTGPGSAGDETTFFGIHTYRALINFQIAHDLPATGYFGPLTRAVLNASASFVGGTSIQTPITNTTTASSTATTTAPSFPAPLPGYAPGQIIFAGGGARDTTPPVIAINGINPITIAQGGTFTDPGATATDNIDGNDTVSTLGTVNTAILGTYTITYSATDKAGNTATATRTVNVVDVTPPVISAISSGTPVGSTATITWTTNEAANSQIEYGLTSTYGATTTLDTNLVTSHSVTLTGLTSDTLYHYRIRTTDGSGNLSTSTDTTVMPTSLYAADVTSISSLVGYWRMNDVAGCTSLADSSTAPHNATVAGTVTCGSTSLLTGSGATSALFNGTNGTASLGSSGEALLHNWDLSQPFSIETIVTPNLTRTNGVFEGRAILSKQSSTSPFPGWEFGLYFNDQVANKTVPEFQLSNGSTFIRVYGSTDLANGTTHHIVVSYDGSGNAAGLDLYVDGVEQKNFVGPNPITGSIVTNIVPQIGSRNGSQFFFKGNIQELALYNTAVGATTNSLIASNVLSAGKPFYHYGLSINRTPPANLTVPNLIFDDQSGNDIDSVAGITLASVLQKRGEINFIGYIEDSVNDRAADTAYAIIKYILPSTTKSFVGAWQGSVPTTNGAGGSAYSTDISTTFGTNTSRTTFTDGVQKYRSLLASQPDNSVVILGEGFSTTLDGVLTSPANAGGDGLPSGLSLLASKVKRLVLTAGLTPSSSGYGAGNNPEFNLANGPVANAADVFANWPTPIVMVGIDLAGENGGTGTLAGPATTTASTTNPVQEAWHDEGQTTRNIWSELGLLFVARGAASGIEVAGFNGSMAISTTTFPGANTFSWTSGNVSWTRKSAADSAFINLVDSMYPALPNAF